MKNIENIRYLVNEEIGTRSVSDIFIVSGSDDLISEYWECINNDKELAKNNKENFVLDKYRHLFINKQYTTTQFKYIASKLNMLSLLFDKLYSKEQLRKNTDYIVYKICNLFLIHNYSLSKQIMLCLNDIYDDLKQINDINENNLELPYGPNF